VNIGTEREREREKMLCIRQKSVRNSKKNKRHHNKKRAPPPPAQRKEIQLTSIKDDEKEERERDEWKL